MAIFKTLPEPSLNESISSPAGSLAKTSAKQESGPVLKALAAAFGLSSPVLLGSFDPDSCSLRTSQASLFETQCPEWSESWPDSGMWASGSVFELQTSARRISESACSSWPTPMMDDHTHDGRDLKHRIATGRQITLGDRVRIWPTTRQGDGESCGNHPGVVDSLTGAAKNWPTPIVDRATYRGARQPEGNPLTLHGMANQWQTPATDSFRSRGGDRKDEMGLDQQARHFPSGERWPTPQSVERETPSKIYRTTTDAYYPDGRKCQPTLADLSTLHQVPTTNDGPPSSQTTPTLPRRLNPRFVEWLMNFPIGWSEL